MGWGHGCTRFHKLVIGAAAAAPAPQKVLEQASTALAAYLASDLPNCAPGARAVATCWSGTLTTKISFDLDQAYRTKSSPDVAAVQADLETLRTVMPTFNAAGLAEGRDEHDAP